MAGVPIPSLSGGSAGGSDYLGPLRTGTTIFNIPGAVTGGKDSLLLLAGAAIVVYLLIKRR